MLRKFLVSIIAAGFLFASAFQVYALQKGDVDFKAGGSRIKLEPDHNEEFHHVTSDEDWTTNISTVVMVADNAGVEVGISWPTTFTTTGKVRGPGTGSLNVEDDTVLLTVTAQLYFMNKDQPMRPYVGVGGAYLAYSDFNVREEPPGYHIMKTKDHDWAWNYQAGGIFDVSDRVFIDASARYIKKNPDVDARVFSVGGGIRF